MSRKKILVLGSTGMAGHVITTFFEEKKNYEVFNLAHSKKLNERTVLLDATDFSKLEAFLDTQAFDTVINCIGILNQYAEAFKGKAVLLNSYLPHFLEDHYKASSTRIVHLSTDCVFSGRTGPYTETSFKDGDSFYDRTKAIGEISGPSSITIRTSIVGPDISDEGIGLFNWFMKSQGQVNGYAKAFWTGVTTIELAKAIESIIEEKLTGIYHLVPDKNISKYELLLLFKEALIKEDIEVLKYHNDVIDKSLINTRRDFKYQVPNYKTMVAEMRDWILRHKAFYPHYQCL